MTRLQDQIRHFVARGIYRAVTDEELAALSQKFKTPKAPPPSPGELTKNREQRHARAHEIRPQSPGQRWNALAQFFAASGFFLFMQEIYSNPETASKPEDLRFILILLCMIGFAWCTMLLQFLCKLLGACTLRSASFSDLRKKLRQAPLKIRSPQHPTAFRTGLVFFLGALLWGLVL